MTKRYKQVVDRRRSRRGSRADPQGSAPPQGTIPVDIEGTDDEENFDEGPNRGHVPYTTTRDMISKLWKYVDQEIKSKFIMHVDNLELDGGAVLQWSMGLDPEMNTDVAEFTNPFSHTCLYRTGLRATGVGLTPMRRLLFADLINRQSRHAEGEKRKSGPSPSRPRSGLCQSNSNVRG